ncbi:MAG: hypothetical protein LWX11_04135 [Firmicutes bacterium]|nr:hypothetical protein [Bacillota bacterium]
MAGTASGCAPSQASDPMDWIHRMVDQGVVRICLVDVNAVQGPTHNRPCLAQLMSAFHRACPGGCIHVGGGIRTSDHAQYFLDHGASRLIVGAIRSRSSMMVDQLLARFHEHLVAAITGPRASENRGLPLQATLQSLRDQGFRRVFFADLPEQPESEPDFETARHLSHYARLPFLMGGKFRTADHLAEASRIPGLQAVLLDARVALTLPDFDAQHCG